MQIKNDEKKARGQRLKFIQGTLISSLSLLRLNDETSDYYSSDLSSEDFEPNRLAMSPSVAMPEPES
jgi:hypothetical protein